MNLESHMLGGYSAKVTTIFTVTPEFNDHTAYTKWLVRMDRILQHSKKRWDFLIRYEQKRDLLYAGAYPQSDRICRRAGSIEVDRRLGLDV